MRSILAGPDSQRTLRRGSAPALSAGATLLGAAALAGYVAGRRAGSRRLDADGLGGRARSGEPLTEADRTLRSVERQAFRILYATRRPVVLEHLGDALGSPLEELESHVTELENRGHLIRNGERQVLGVAGLSVAPTQHVFVKDGIPRWTWCAWDALGIGALLGGGTAVRSHCPQTGTPIEVRFKRRRLVSTPRSAVLTFPERSSSCVTVKDWCPLVNLIATPESARLWMESNDVTAQITPVVEAAQDSARSYRPLLYPLPN